MEISYELIIKNILQKKGPIESGKLVRLIMIDSGKENVPLKVG